MPNLPIDQVEHPILIECDRVQVTFQNAGSSATATNILQDLSLRVHEGEIVTLLGASGCGKSTLLRSIAGLQALSGGTIQYAGHQRGRADGEIGFVFQEATLLDWRTVWQNVRLPLELQSKGYTARDDERIRALLEAVSLKESDFAKRPDQLSGGMKMRVALARALVTSPKILLLDEPFAALDDVLRNQLNDLLLNLWATQKITILFVTHNIAEAIYLSNRIAIMHRGSIARELPIDFPYPREKRLRSSKEFAELYGDVSAVLENQIGSPSGVPV